jgi:hypothetical protein
MATARKSAAPARGKKKATIAVDFSDTEKQGVIDEGDYILKVDDVEQKESDAGNSYLAITFLVDEGEFQGKKVYHNCSLQPQALFNLRGVLEALGFEVPTGVMDLDPADMIGETCGAAIAHETYEGKTKARPVEFFPAEDMDGRGEEEAPPPKKAAKAEAPAKVVKKGAKPEPEEAPPPVSKKKKKAAEPELAEGDEVTFTDDEGNELTGVIKEIDDDTYTVVTGKGKKAEEWELEAADLTKVEED